VSLSLIVRSERFASLDRDASFLAKALARRLLARVKSRDVV
jgi:hypothetical protein